MIKLGLVPARAGSKGVPNKNTRLIGGRPLLAWAVEIGLQTCDVVYVTTDDPNIGLLAAQYGAKAIVSTVHGDSTPMLAVVQDALLELKPTLKPDVVVLLQPTQPLRTVRHVQEGLVLLTDDWDSVCSVVEVPRRWARAGIVVDDRLLVDETETRRQDVAPRYVRDGTFYVTRVEAIKNGTLYGDCRAYRVPESESCNIDTLEDWNRAERMMAARAA
jgi:CMP-N-acetylneuraminic acid synthetase